MAEDAFKCFATLLESIPAWIADLENIVRTATSRQQDLLRENQPAEKPQIPQRNPSKSTSSSMRMRRSIQFKDHEVHSPKSGETEPTLVQTQLPHMTQSDALRLAQRKRKTASVCSDRQSGPLKYRSRSMVVVYYDGEVQKQFENIVRAIGTSRNSLRRGKMSAKVAGLARTQSNGSESRCGEDGVPSVPKLPYRSTRSAQSPAAGRIDGTEIFDKVDGVLEKAQSMCERAAHQVLRDGDCGLEIKNAKEHFTDARKLGEAELPVWKDRAEKAAERERLSEERRRAEAEERDKKPPPVYSSSEKLVGEQLFSSPTALEVDLEPDDSDDDEGQDFTLQHMQLGRPYFRSAKLAAH